MKRSKLWHLYRLWCYRETYWDNPKTGEMVIDHENMKYVWLFTKLMLTPKWLTKFYDRHLLRKLECGCAWSRLTRKRRLYCWDHSGLPPRVRG